MGCDTAPVWGDDQQASAAGENPPYFFQHRTGLLAGLDGVNDENPVDRIIGEGEFALVCEGRQIGSLKRPAEHPERGRHQRDGALGLRCNRREKRRGVPYPEQPHAAQVGPYAMDCTADHPSRDKTETGPIKVPQIDDVGGHRKF
jgi:hypothetical protein